MTTEWGALTGLFPVDAKTIQWYADRLERWQKRKAASATATARSPLERVTEADLRYRLWVRVMPSACTSLLFST